MVSRSRVSGAPIRCRSPILAATRTICKLLEQWMRSYQPEKLFDENGRLSGELQALAPSGSRRMGANPHANGGLLKRELKLPDFHDYAVKVPSPGSVEAEATRVMGQFLREVVSLNAEARNFRIMGPDETASNPPRCGIRCHRAGLDGAHRAVRRPSGPGWPRDGSFKRTPLSGLARGISAHRPSRPVLVLRGLHSHRGFDVQPARQMAEGFAWPALAAPESLR